MDPPVERPGNRRVVARSLCIETVYDDGEAVLERLVYSPY
jgi:hypothetical protein